MGYTIDLSYEMQKWVEKYPQGSKKDFRVFVRNAIHEKLNGGNVVMTISKQLLLRFYTMKKTKLKKCGRCKNEYNIDDLEQILVPRYVAMLGKPIGHSEIDLCEHCFGVLNTWLNGKKE